MMQDFVVEPSSGIVFDTCTPSSHGRALPQDGTGTFAAGKAAVAVPVTTSENAGTVGGDSKRSFDEIVGRRRPERRDDHSRPVLDQLSGARCAVPNDRWRRWLPGSSAFAIPSSIRLSLCAQTSSDIFAKRKAASRSGPYLLPYASATPIERLVLGVAFAGRSDSALASSAPR